MNPRDETKEDVSEEELSMIRSLFGIGQNKMDREACVQEAVKDFRNPKIIFFFSDEKHFPEYAGLIHERFPDAVSIGCSSYRFWAGPNAGVGELTVTAIEEGISCSAGVIEKADSFALDYMDNVQQSLDQISDKNNTVCVEFTSASRQAEEYALMTLNSVLLRHNIPIVGGSSANSGAGADMLREAYIALNGKVYTEGCVFVLIHNEAGAVHMFRENIYVPLTGREFLVTKANSHSRTIMQYDDETALSVYASELGIPMEDADKYFFHHPLGRHVGDETYLTAIQSSNSNQSLKLHARVHEGTKMMVMQVGDYREIVHKTVDDIKRTIPNPALVICIHCVARVVFLESENYLEEYRKLLAGAFPNSIHVSCLGEQFGTGNFNHTLMILVLAEE